MAFAIGILGILVYQSKAQAQAAQSTQAVPAATQAVPAATQAVPAAAPVAAQGVYISPKEEPKQAAASKEEFKQPADYHFEAMVPWYRNSAATHPTELFGTAVCELYEDAASTNLPEARKVQMAVADCLQNAFTLQVLQQDNLHVPEYTALVQLAATTKRPDIVEGVQAKRLNDEAAIEALANPSLWQRIKWWWNS
jgi:hypothetical protein